MKQCKHCNTEFKPKRVGTNQLFCSRTCYIADLKPVVNKCINCGNDTKTKFCSRSCSASYNNTIKPKRRAKSKPPKKERVTRTPEEAYKRKRAIYNEANARYMSRRKFQTPADEDIKSLQEFYANCPVGYEVDHIIPISKGGLHSLSNLQYLTKSENRKKSNKL